MVQPAPDLQFEIELLRAGALLVLGCDEVGRGAIAGPVAVGVFAVGPDCVSAEKVPSGLRDSKLLSPAKREALIPSLRSWSSGLAVGMSSAAEVDREGIIDSLAAAAIRAIDEIEAGGVDLSSCVLILDGSHDWLGPKLAGRLRVLPRVKADRDCASVAAASVIAKVTRDSLMVEAATRHPDYGWEKNKGYGSAAHFEAIRRSGPSELHRLSWLGSV
ncbi:MAG: ribonuclease HII [Microbacteriaceae bacterium]|nr:ribonuclease HII [Microbacteriaceae bacterium]